MTHLAIDSRLAERSFLHGLIVEPYEPELARVACRAIALIARCAGQAREHRNVSPLTRRRIDRRPIIQPLLLQCAVLNGENEDPVVGQLRRVRLLPLGTDHIVHAESLPSPPAYRRKIEERMVAAPRSDCHLASRVKKL